MRQARLKEHRLEGLLEPLRAGVAALSEQASGTAEELNSKFAADGSGKIELTYGSLATFDGGLEGMIGPALTHVESAELSAVSTTVGGHVAGGAPTLLGQMELEHCAMPDSEVPFPSQMNEPIVKPSAQWAFVLRPAAAGYHVGTTCAVTGSAPIYGALYRPASGEGPTLSASAHAKLCKKLEAKELTAEELKKKAGGLTPEQLRACIKVRAAGADAFSRPSFLSC